ncbi:MAG: hypothetical protein HOQ35_01920 [Acidobacteriaceae bacterium]|nr:hypothetical protein [Acidobacteriaceae bacterium]
MAEEETAGHPSHFRAKVAVIERWFGNITGGEYSNDQPNRQSKEDYRWQEPDRRIETVPKTGEPRRTLRVRHENCRHATSLEVQDVGDVAVPEPANLCPCMELLHELLGRGLFLFELQALKENLRGERRYIPMSRLKLP